MLDAAIERAEQPAYVAVEGGAVHGFCVVLLPPQARGGVCCRCCRGFLPAWAVMDCCGVVFSRPLIGNQHHQQFVWLNGLQEHKCPSTRSPRRNLNPEMTALT